MPRRVIDAWDYFYHKMRCRRNKNIKIREIKEKENGKERNS